MQKLYYLSNFTWFLKNDNLCGPVYLRLPTEISGSARCESSGEGELEASTAAIGSASESSVALVALLSQALLSGQEAPS